MKSNSGNNNNNLETMRHSAAHILAIAVKEIFPTVKLGIGPAIENGFYYDFDLPRKLTPDDLPLIEKGMRKIIKARVKFEKMDFPTEEAKKLFASQPYKLELIDELRRETASAGVISNEVRNPNRNLSPSAQDDGISIYRTGDFIDLCRGPHVKDTSEIKAFKLTHLAGAYWKGSEKNPMLTRIYGIAFPSQEELDAHLKLQEEAKRRDHRKIGQELDLFVFSELVGKGLPLFTEKGAAIRRELERFIVDEEIERGYQHVYTPDIAKVELYEKSGHYPYYKDSMYPIMQVDEERLILRPMTCPHHFQLYASRPRSYRELPLRIAELAKQYRYEKSGELTGLIRVRLFCLADAHIICRKDQVESEINNVLNLIDDMAKVLGLKIGKDYRYRLSKSDRGDEKKFFKDDTAWDFAEDILRKILKERRAPFFEADGEAAFYGPKIDIQMKNASGKEETAFTVQYDFVMPKRFELCYIDQDGEKKEPVVIHRSSIGALERVIAFLVERYAGAFPVWLSPVQAIVIPVSDKFLGYADRVVEALRGSDPREGLTLRVELDGRKETLPAKIRDAQLQKIPYMLIVGGKEAQKAKKGELQASVRLRDGSNLGLTELSRFIKRIREKIDTKALDL